MKILFVAFPFSVHTARWISQLADSGFDIHLFSSMPGHELHSDIKGVTYHENFFEAPNTVVTGNRYVSTALKPLSFVRSPLLKKVIRKSVSFSGYTSRTQQLTKVIKKIKPDIIHTMETQHAGYMLNAVKNNFKGKFPIWIHSIWGIDLHFYGQLEKHVPAIKQTLSGIDFLIVEGERDKQLAIEFGFTGKINVFQSVGGGFIVPPVWDIKPSARTKILVKGTQDMVRRGLVAIRAVERCIDVLRDYEIILYSSNEITEAAAELFYRRTGKVITVLHNVSREKMIQLNAEARLSICVNMSDGVPNAMLEAMMMGAFPVQSNTAMANEFIIHEKTGMIVPPEDPDMLEAAIRKVLTEDEMVDAAAAINRKLIEDRFNYHNIRKEVIEMYNGAVTKN